MSIQMNVNQPIVQQVISDSNNVVAVVVAVADIYNLSLKQPCDCVNYEEPVYKIGSDGRFDEKETPPKMKNNNFVITPYNFNSPESGGSSNGIDPNIDFDNFTQNWMNYVSDNDDDDDKCNDTKKSKTLIDDDKNDKMVEQIATDYNNQELYYAARISQYYEDQEYALQQLERSTKENQDNLQHPPGFTPKSSVSSASSASSASSIKKICKMS
jgi:hypothetical protein